MRLYASAENGYCFENLRNNIVGYQGATVMLVKTMAGDIFGAVAADTWKDGGYGGGSRCFLFSIAPQMRIYRSNTSSNCVHQYFNSRGYDRSKQGLGFGRGDGGFASSYTKQVASTESSFLEAWTTAMLYRPVPPLKLGFGEGSIRLISHRCSRGLGLRGQ